MYNRDSAMLPKHIHEYFSVLRLRVFVTNKEKSFSHFVEKSNSIRDKVFYFDIFCIHSSRATYASWLHQYDREIACRRWNPLKTSHHRRPQIAIDYHEWRKSSFSNTRGELCRREGWRQEEERGTFTTKPSVATCHLQRSQWYYAVLFWLRQSFFIETRIFCRMPHVIRCSANQLWWLTIGTCWTTASQLWRFLDSH